MAITNGYATLAEAQAFIATSQTVETANDALIERAVEAASRAIDRFCDRRFYAQTNQTRYYDPPSGSILHIDDLTTLTSLKTDAANDDTYENTWATSDYLLLPHNAAADGWPYTGIQRRAGGDYQWPTYVKSIQIVGDFGWPSVPTDVELACLILASRYFFRKNTPDGVLGVGELGVVRVSPQDKDVISLLAPYRRLVVA